MAEEQNRAEAEIGKFAGTYSADVELDADGVIKWARDIEKGETVSIPMHLFARVQS